MGSSVVEYGIAKVLCRGVKLLSVFLETVSN